jgi:hypothetical protein
MPAARPKNVKKAAASEISHVGRIKSLPYRPSSLKMSEIKKAVREIVSQRVVARKK